MQKESHVTERNYVLFRTLLVYAFAMALFLSYANFTTSRSVRDANSKLVTIERVNTTVVTAVRWGSSLAALALLTSSAISFKRGWLRWPGAGLLLGLVVYPWAFINHTVHNLGPWTTHGRVVAKNGKQFVFCDSSFLQGQTMAIAEIASSGPLRSKYRVLVDNNGDSPRSWASVIRPDTSADEYGQLHLCGDRFLVGIRHTNHCYLIYDLKKKLAIGHDLIQTISPFICLSKNDNPKEADVRETIKRIQHHANLCVTNDQLAADFLVGNSIPGCPSMKSVRAGFEHDNLDVKSIAQRIANCYAESIAIVESRGDQ